MTMWTLFFVGVILSGQTTIADQQYFKDEKECRARMATLEALVKELKGDVLVSRCHDKIKAKSPERPPPVWRAVPPPARPKIRSDDPAALG